MAETSILPGSAPAAFDGGTAVPPPPDVEETPDNRRRLMILGAVVAVVVVAAAAFMLLHKGSSSSTATGLVPRGTPHAQAPAGGSHAKSTSGGSHSGHKAASGGKSTPTKLPRKSHVSLARDPFKPLVLPPSDSSGSSQSGPTTTVSPGPQPSSGVSPQPTAPVVVPPVVTPTTPPATTGSGGGHGVKGAPLWIRLVRTSGQHSATFDVGYAHHKFRRFKVIAPKATANNGTVFDKEFALLGIQNGQVTIQVGDDTPFDLSKGVSHSV